MNKLIIQDALTRKIIVLFVQQSIIKNYIYCELEVSGPHDMEAAGKKKGLKQPYSGSSTSKHSRFLHLLTKNSKFNANLELCGLNLFRGGYREMHQFKFSIKKVWT